MPKFRSLSLEGTMLRSDVGTTLRFRVWGLGLRGQKMYELGTRTLTTKDLGFKL